MTRPKMDETAIVILLIVHALLVAWLSSGLPEEAEVLFRP